VGDVTIFCRSEYAKLVGFLDLYCGDLGVAEELAQESLARAWKNWRRIDAYDDPSAWVRRVAINLANSYFRRKRAERRANERFSHESPETEPPRDQAAAIVLREELGRLPQRIRAPLVLRYYAGLSFKEIGMLVDKPEATVRSLVHRGVQQLRSSDTFGELREAFDVG
jgi:RNA polymerase sigma-70 factor (ECF subfamily)